MNPGQSGSSCSKRSKGHFSAMCEEEPVRLIREQAWAEALECFREAALLAVAGDAEGSLDRLNRATRILWGSSAL